MGLFGNKDDDKKKQLIGSEEADDKLLAAIEEAEAEMEQDKADKATARKEAQEKANQDAKRLEEAKAKIMESLPNQGRRAYMMVTELVEATDTLLRIKGKVFGEIHVEDTLYIYRPGGTVVEAKITKLAPVAEEINEEEVPETVNACKNCPVVISLSIDAIRLGIIPEKIAPFGSVVASIKPQTVADKKTPVENPALLGMSLVYKDYKDNKDYLNALFRHIINARFILPAHVDATKVNEEGKKALQLITCKNQNDEVVLPIFTDIPALTGWKELFEGEVKPQIVVMTFPEIVKLTEKDGLNFVINVRGPIAIEIPRKITDVIVSSKGYQEQFAAKKKYTKETISDEAHKILVGEVPQSAESDAIRETLKTYGASHGEIISIGLLAMRRNDKNGYLIIVDCPKSVSREIFADIKNACAPHMNAIKELSFSLYAETVFADKYFSNHAFTYVKNPNL